MLHEESKKIWKFIMTRLAAVGKGGDDSRIDYFSSLVPRHLNSYARLVDKEYGPDATKEQLKLDWNQTTVVDTLSRIVGLDDEAHRRGVRILVHFLDFSMHERSSQREDREERRIRFDIYELMQELRTLKGTDEAKYDQTLEELRALEAGTEEEVTEED